MTVMGIVGHDLRSPLSAVVLDTAICRYRLTPPKLRTSRRFSDAFAEAASAPGTSRAS